MRNRTGFLHLLRCERGALSALAATAMLARVFIGVLGLVMAPGGAAATGPGLIICSGSTGGSQPVKGAPWGAMHCPCAACHHAGCAIACTPPPTGAQLAGPGFSHSLRIATPRDTGHIPQRTGDHTRIRAPPLPA